MARPYPRHWHEGFQFCLLLSGAGDLIYRGSRHFTPPHSLFIVNPGEAHANVARDREGCSFRTMVVRDEELPFFRTTVVFDNDLISLFLRLHITLEAPGAALEAESLLLDLLTALVSRHAGGHSGTQPVSTDSRAVRLARDYLDEHFAENISLTRLAEIANLSPFHLNRMFRTVLGMPPHAYQTQVRVIRAKVLLRQSGRIAEIASRTGFADQSHLTRHFKRLVGVTPGEYQRGPANGR